MQDVPAALALTKHDVVTLPTLAVSSFAFSSTNMTPCEVDAAASSSSSADGAARPPTISSKAVSDKSDGKQSQSRLFVFKNHTGRRGALLML